jgi:hypothetical protein
VPSGLLARVVDTVRPHEALHPVKNSHRLDYASLAEILGQRSLIESQRLKLALQTSQSGPIPFPEVLVGESLIGDWDLSRIVCEIYGLPFLPVDLYSPSADALAQLDQDFLRQHRLVPLTRHKRVLTICMPALVPADVLGKLSQSTDLLVMPVVGSVNSNNKWLAEHLAAPELQGGGDGGIGDWNKIFDEGDAAVLLNLDQDSKDPPQQAA